MNTPRTTVLSLSAAAAICLTSLLTGSAATVSSAIAAPEDPSSTASASWEPIGPNGQAGAIARAPGDPDHAVLIPSFGVGPWVTEDAGATWHQLPDPPGVRNAGDENRVIIDPDDRAHWWYAGTAATTAETVLLETLDDGRTWTESARFTGELLSFLLTGDGSTTVLATTTGPTTVAVHSRSGSAPWVAQAIDTGSSIRQVTSLDDALVLRGHFAMWRLDAPGSGSAPVEIYRVSEEARRAVDEAFSIESSEPDDEDVDQIWDLASTDSVIVVNELGRGIVGSTDDGATWTDWAVPHHVAAISSTGDTVYLVRSEPGQRWVDVTTDAGASFTEMRIPDDGAIEHEFTTWADGSITSANPRSGLYRTTDGGDRWQRIGVQGTSGLDLLQHQDRLLAGTEYGLASTTIPATSDEWGITGGEARVGTTVAEIAAAGDDLPIWEAVNAAFNELQLHSSTDGGKTWEEQSTIFGVARELLVHPANPDLVVMTWQMASTCGVHSTRDGGETWTTTRGDCFDAVVGDPSDPDRVWFGGPTGLFRSDDGGATGARVSDIPAAAILLDKHRIIIGGDDLYMSEDDGATFTKSATPDLSTAGTQGMQVTSLVRSGPRMFAGFTTGTNTAESGVLISSDRGRTWTPFSTGLQNSEVLSLAVGPDDDTLFAGTRAGGVHTTELPPRVAPTATTDIAHTRTGEPVRLDVLGNDSGGDLDIDPSTVSIRPADGDDDVPWTTSLAMPGTGAFTVDLDGGAVMFTPEASFVGDTGAVAYRFANTDGDIAEGELSVFVDALVGPGDGSGSGEGSGGDEADGSNTMDPLATTGVNALAFMVGAVVLLAAGAALAFRARLRRGLDRQRADR